MLSEFQNARVNIVIHHVDAEHENIVSLAFGISMDACMFTHTRMIENTCTLVNYKHTGKAYTRPPRESKRERERV